jgi:hypothetical protein
MIANKMFEFEGAIANGANIERVEFPLYGSYDRSLVDHLESMFDFLFDKRVRVSLAMNNQERLTTSDEEDGDILSDGYTCLFSLGLDSFSGITNAVAHYDDLIGAFVSHADQRNLVPLLKKFQRGPLKQAGITVKRINATDHEPFLRRSRGIFYIMNAITLGRRNFLVCDIGPTMYPTPFTILDKITVTTHPKMLEYAKIISKDILNKEVRILTPNENLTKAEVAAACQSSSFIKKTFSCTRTSFANSPIPNCGTCYSCIVRRMGALVAGVVDSKYRNDFTTIANRSGAYDNLVQLLRFSMDFIDDPEQIPWYSLEIPRAYEKLELFERFALDNIVGLKILDDLMDLSSPLAKIRSLATTVVTDNQLEERIAVVQEGQYQPRLVN